MRRIILKYPLPFGVALGLLFALPFSSRAEAASCPSAAEASSFTEALRAANAEPDYARSVRMELRARKEFLSATLDCAEQEVKDLKGQLAAAHTSDPDISRVASLLVSRLAEATAYYENQRSALNEAGVRGSQDIARAVRDWRAGVLAPLAGNVANLSLWFKNQELLQTAEVRFAQVGNTITILKLSDRSDIQSVYADAATNLSAAKDAENAARRILLATGSPDDSLAKIKDCLSNLSLLYHDFFTISDAVDKLLTK